MLTCPSLSSPMFSFAIELSERKIVGPQIFFHRCNVKAYVQKSPHFYETTCKITQIILTFLNKLSVTN